MHGDYSPKNILADGSEVVVLDFEVAHWGDPRFDVGFCLSHLILKTLRRQASRPAMTGLIDAFVAAYRAVCPPIIDQELTQITACLMLARLHGASPVDYRADLDGDEVKALAGGMLTQPHRPLGDWLDQIRGNT